MSDVLTGPLGLFIRLGLIWASGWLASQGIGLHDEAAGTFTIHIESLANVLAAAMTGGAWLAWWRIAKRKGGTT